LKFIQKKFNFSNCEIVYLLGQKKSSGPTSRVKSNKMSNWAGSSWRSSQVEGDL